LIRDATPFERLFAGYRHGRLLVLGRPPAAVKMNLDGWERVACIAATDDDCRPGIVRADPHHLPFTEALFDKALLSAPLVQPRLMLRELWRVLGPAGLAVLVVRARRPWHVKDLGWLREPLALRLDEAMFEVLEWRIELLPERHHVVLVGKRDWEKPALAGAAEAGMEPRLAH
jgi:SAM-dependent methyltransferase